MDRVYFSAALCDLVEKMLSKEFRQRPTASHCLHHHWLAHATDKLVMSDETIDRLNQIRQANHIQQIAADIILGSCNIAQMGELNALFRQMDADNDGCLTAEEVRA